MGGGNWVEYVSFQYEEKNNSSSGLKNASSTLCSIPKSLYCWFPLVPIIMFAFEFELYLYLYLYLYLNCICIVFALLGADSSRA